MKPAEELYHIADDPLELRNRIADETAAKAREKLRALYDARVKDWKQRGVDYNNYPPFGPVFTRKK